MHWATVVALGIVFDRCLPVAMVGEGVVENEFLFDDVWLKRQDLIFYTGKDVC